MDHASLERIKEFAAFIERAKQADTELSFISTPTEHGDNITAAATIDGKRQNVGILFWDVRLLQDCGFVDVLDDDDLALGMNITDGMVEDAARLLQFAELELAKLQ